MSSPLSFTSSSVLGQDGNSALAPLLAPLESLPGVSTARAKLLGRIAGGRRVMDLLFCLPESITDRRLRPTLAQLRPDTIATVTGVVQDIRSPAPRTRQPWRVMVDDARVCWKSPSFPPGWPNRL